MQNSERQPFEKSWKSAFDGAEMSPPDSLWTAIELEVAGRETDVMKRRVVIYQRIAAATVIFALVSGGLAVYTYRGAEKELASAGSSLSGTTPKVTTPATTDQSNAMSPEVSASSSATNGQAPAATNQHTISKSGTKAGEKSGNSQQQGPPTVVGNVPTIVLAKDEDQIIEAESNTEAVALSNNEQSVTNQETTAEKTQASNQQPEEETVTELLSAEQINALAEANAKEEKEEKETDRSTWLGVGGAAGSYTPEATMSGGKVMSAADSYNTNYASQGTPQSASHTVGSAYSAGVSGGVRLAKRWVVQSGINYISQQLDYTTNFVGISNTNKATAMTHEFMSDPSVASVAVTTVYEASSTTEVLSVPVQAGFIIVDRRLGWQLNSGVSTDFFLQNTLSDKSGLREDISEGSGGESPYRAVNWSGLLNTEISYRIGEHYKLALVPGLRYTFQSYLKEQSGGSPLIVDIGFRFNYLFN